MAYQEPIQATNTLFSAEHTPEYLMSKQNYAYAHSTRSKIATRNETTFQLGKGIRVKSQSKEVVYNIYSYFKKLHAKGKSQAPIKRTIEATGIGETTIRSVLKEKEEKGKFESPAKRYRSYKQFNMQF